MARYRKIEVRIWNDQKFRALSDRGKLAFLFLLSHPHMTSLGAMRATLAGLASELGWTEKAFREAFGEALAKAIAKHDETACFVGLPNFLKHNPPESPNVVKSWRDQVDLIPECEMKHELLQHVKAFTEGLGKAFAEALPEAFAKAMPYPEPNPKPEPKHDPKEIPAESSAEPPVLVFDCVGTDEKTWPLTSGLVAEFSEAYPDLDVIAECRKAKAWCLANPRNRKTFDGMPRFLNGWLGKAQNNGAGRTNGAGGGVRNRGGSARLRGTGLIEDLERQEAAARAAGNAAGSDG